MLPVLTATSCANWDLKLDGKSSEAEVAMSSRAKPYPVNSAGVICGLTNLKDKQEDIEFLTFQNVSF